MGKLGILRLHADEVLKKTSVLIFVKQCMRIPYFMVQYYYYKEIIMTLRNERVRKELMRDISDILRKEIRGLVGVVSVLDVEVSHDNSFAKVIYSVLGSPEQVEKTKEVMEKSTPKIRYEVGKRIRLRLTPELKFVYTDSLEKGSRVSELIDKISRGEL